MGCCGRGCCSDLFGLLAFGLSGWDCRWLAGAALPLASWPWTLLGIMPTNHRLHAIPPGQAGPESRHRPPRRRFARVARNLNRDERLWRFFKKKTLGTIHDPSLTAISGFIDTIAPREGELAFLLPDSFHPISHEGTRNSLEEWFTTSWRRSFGGSLGRSESQPIGRRAQRGSSLAWARR